MSYIDPVSRVPFFMFQDREHGRDEALSKEKGYDVPRMETFILIAPHGHKGDPMEFIATEFLERKGREARDGRYDHAWVSEFKAGLAAHKDGKELPRTGTPLATWERILKSRRDILCKRYPTLEDLAATPDSSLGEIGLDGRVLRDMAKAELQAKKDLTPIVRELADANEEIRRQQEQIDKLTRRLDAMQGDEEKPKRGRPKLEQAA